MPSSRPSYVLGRTDDAPFCQQIKVHVSIRGKGCHARKANVLLSAVWCKVMPRHWSQRLVELHSGTATSISISFNITGRGISESTTKFRRQMLAIGRKGRL